MTRTFGKAVFGLVLAGALGFGATQAVAVPAQPANAAKACPGPTCHSYCKQFLCPNGPPCSGYCDLETGECVCYYL